MPGKNARAKSRSILDPQDGSGVLRNSLKLVHHDNLLEVRQPADLAGYRSERVFVRNSMHVPLPPNAVRDAMPVFFENLEQEEHPAVRVLLGHFIFVYIHPYMDGNGRMGRFLMNVMMAAGGYPWTVIPVQRRADYMAALERASTHLDIAPFAHFIGDLVRRGMSGERTAELPAGTARN